MVRMSMQKVNICEEGPFLNFFELGLNKVVKFFCLEIIFRKMGTFFSVRIGNFRNRIHDPQTSNQIDAAVLLLLFNVVETYLEVHLSQLQKIQV